MIEKESFIPIRHFSPILWSFAMTKDDVVIVSATRTPVGAFNGGIIARP
jgi:hypothetical protein